MIKNESHNFSVAYLCPKPYFYIGDKKALVATLHLVAIGDQKCHLPVIVDFPKEKMSSILKLSQSVGKLSKTPSLAKVSRCKPTKHTLLLTHPNPPINPRATYVTKHNPSFQSPALDFDFRPSGRPPVLQRSPNRSR